MRDRTERQAEKRGKAEIATLRAVNAILMVCLCTAIVLFGVIMAPRFFGIEPYTIETESMYPEMPAGSIAYVDHNVKPQSLEPGDIALCVAGDNQVDVIHRVVSNDQEGQTLVTKGDANSETDGVIPYEAYQGKEVFHAPALGNGLKWIIDNKFLIVINFLAFMAFLIITSRILDSSIRRQLAYEDQLERERAEAERLAMETAKPKKSKKKKKKKHKEQMPINEEEESLVEG